jgi:HTH-type transcriptional regulator/antitoxin HigA
MQIRPIKTTAEHRAALKAIERLMGSRPGTLDGDRLDVLTLLVERYEEEADAIEPPDPIEALRHHMESRGLTRRDLEPFIGSRARVAEVLNRRRALTIDMIRRLHEGLGLSADVLIRPYDWRGCRSAATIPATSPRRHRRSSFKE